MNLFSLLSIATILFAQALTPEQEVEQADKQLNQYIIEHNVTAATDVYTDDFVLTVSSGTQKSKQDLLKEIGLVDLKLEINETTNVKVRVLNNAAVLTGTLHQKGLYKDKAFDNKLLVTDTWVLVNSRWKILAGHATLIKQP